MKTESGSIRTEAPIFRSPAVSQVQGVERIERFSGSRPSSWKKSAAVQTKERNVAPDASSPALRRSIRSPRSAIATTATAGEKSAVQARTSMR